MDRSRSVALAPLDAISAGFSAVPTCLHLSLDVSSFIVVARLVTYGENRLVLLVMNLELLLSRTRNTAHMVLLVLD